MRLPEKVAMQMRKPAGGFLGRMITRGMIRNTAEANEWTISLLEPGADEWILEIGFGPGKALHKLSGIIENGYLVGIDWSEEMVLRAGRLNATCLDKGKMTLICGDINNRQTFEDLTFDAVFSVHGIYFWEDPQVCITECFRILKPGGRLALTYWSAEKSSKSRIMQTSVFNLLGDREIEQLFIHAGFKQIRIVTKRLKYAPAVCVLGIK